MAVPPPVARVARVLLGLLLVAGLIGRVGASGESGATGDLLPWLRMRSYKSPGGQVASPKPIHSVVPDQWFTSCAVAEDRRAPPDRQIQFDTVYLSPVAPSEFDADSDDGPPTLKIVALGNIPSQQSAVENGSTIVSSISMQTRFVTFPISNQLASLCDAMAPTGPDPVHELGGGFHSCTYGPGTIGLGVEVPLQHLYPLGSIHAQVEVLSSGQPTLTLGCLMLSWAQYAPSAWYWRFILLLPICVAAGFFLLALLARPWAAVTASMEVRWSEQSVTAVASNAWGGSHILSSPPLRRFLTPGLTDVWLVFQWAASLAMVAVDWPESVYPVLKQMLWTCLLVDVKLVQRSNQPVGIRYDPLALQSSLPEGDYAWAGEQMTSNTSSPLFLGPLSSSSSNSGGLNPRPRGRQSIINLSGAHQGIEALLRMTGLHPQDGFGTCTGLFLIILAALVTLSVLTGVVHLTWLACSRSKKRGSHAPIPTDAPEGEAPRPRHVTLEARKHRAQDVLDGHLAALQGNLIRMLILFHFPLTVMSTYQFSTYHDHTLAMAIVSFIVFSLLAPLGALWHLRLIPPDMGEDRAVLLALGPLYNTWSSPPVGSRVCQLYFLGSLCTGIVVGAGQGSGTAQAAILFCFDIIRAGLCFFSLAREHALFFPFTTMAGGFNTVFYTVVRPLGGLLVLLLCPAVDLSRPVADWITWVLLVLMGLTLLGLVALLVSKVCQGVVRMITALSFHADTYIEPSTSLTETAWGTIIGRLQARRERGKPIFPNIHEAARPGTRRESCWTETAHLLRTSFRSTIIDTPLKFEEVTEDGMAKKPLARKRQGSTSSFPSLLRPLSSSSFLLRPLSMPSTLFLAPQTEAEERTVSQTRGKSPEADEENFLAHYPSGQDTQANSATASGQTSVQVTLGHSPPSALVDVTSDPPPLTVPLASNARASPPPVVRPLAEDKLSRPVHPGGFVRVSGRKVTQSDPYGLLPPHAPPPTPPQPPTSSSSSELPARSSPEPRTRAPIMSSAQAYLLPPARESEARQARPRGTLQPEGIRKGTPFILKEEGVTSVTQHSPPALPPPERSNKHKLRYSFSQGQTSVQPTESPISPSDGSRRWPQLSHMLRFHSPVHRHSTELGRYTTLLPKEEERLKPLSDGNAVGPSPGAVTPSPRAVSSSDASGTTAVRRTGERPPSTTFPQTISTTFSASLSEGEGASLPAVALGRVVGGTGRQHVPARKSPLAGKALNMSSLGATSTTSSQSTTVSSHSALASAHPVPAQFTREQALPADPLDWVRAPPVPQTEPLAPLRENERGLRTHRDPVRPRRRPLSAADMYARQPP